MKYKQQILDLALDANPKALFNWILKQPLLEQVVILREFKQMVLQNMFKSQNFSSAETLKEFTKNIDEYEKEVLAELDAETQYKDALEEQEKAMQQIETTTVGIKQYVLSCIVNNEPNAAEMKGLAQKIIALEKEQGTHNPDFWEAIL